MREAEKKRSHFWVGSELAAVIQLANIIASNNYKSVKLTCEKTNNVESFLAGFRWRIDVRR